MTLLSRYVSLRVLLCLLCFATPVLSLYDRSETCTMSFTESLTDSLTFSITSLRTASGTVSYNTHTLTPSAPTIEVTATHSTTLSLSLPRDVPTILELADVDNSTTGPTLPPKTATASTVVSLAASSLGGAVAADLQTLLALQLLPCASPPATIPMSAVYGLSFLATSNTCTGVVYGAFIAVAASIGLSFVGALIWMLWKKTTIVDAMAATRCPSLVFIIAVFHLNGLLVCSPRFVTGDHGLAAATILLASITIILLPLTAWLCVPRQLQFLWYTSTRCPGLIPFLRLYMPSSVHSVVYPASQQFGAVVGQWRHKGHLWPLCRVLSALALLPCVIASGSSCAGLYSTSALLHIAFSILLLLARPYRVPLVNILSAAGLSLNGALIASDAAKLSSDPSDFENHAILLDIVGRVTAVVSVFQLVLSILRIGVSVSSTFVFVLARRSDILKVRAVVCPHVVEAPVIWEYRALCNNFVATANSTSGQLLGDGLLGMAIGPAPPVEDDFSKKMVAKGASGQGYEESLLLSRSSSNTYSPSHFSSEVSLSVESLSPPQTSSPSQGQPDPVSSSYSSVSPPSSPPPPQQPQQQQQQQQTQQQQQQQQPQQQHQSLSNRLPSSLNSLMRNLTQQSEEPPQDPLSAARSFANLSALRPPRRSTILIADKNDSSNDNYRREELLPSRRNAAKSIAPSGDNETVPAPRRLLNAATALAHSTRTRGQSFAGVGNTFDTAADSHPGRISRSLDYQNLDPDVDEVMELIKGKKRSKTITDNTYVYDVYDRYVPTEKRFEAD